jgi:hypothetical protein
VAASILALLDRMDHFVANTEDTRPPAEPGQIRPHLGTTFVIVAACLAMTPDVPVPDVAEAVQVDERVP